MVSGDREVQYCYDYHREAPLFPASNLPESLSAGQFLLEYV